ncbi:MAG: hypothetical protein EZS28_026354 [Streblomastix strix]|uniref:Uncharacterized protein n=1 Tax=Streblomastix strix TaxID=222440 RepID=A0A5J4V5W6_9EUKA|nr:MAG: hypothetical protein EZS28_026354 [Streblomastix strix]
MTTEIFKISTEEETLVGEEVVFEMLEVIMLAVTDQMFNLAAIVVIAEFEEEDMDQVVDLNIATVVENMAFAMHSDIDLTMEGNTILVIILNSSKDFAAISINILTLKTKKEK